jgi:hypothetical protein
MTEGKLLACGACGIRQMEHKHPDVQYKPVKLTDPMMDVLKYSHDAAVDLHHKLQCKVTIAVDEQGTQAEICPWRMISFYEPPCSIQQSAEDVTYFHLHPELVSCCQDEPYTYLWICVCLFFCQSPTYNQRPSGAYLFESRLPSVIRA